MYPSKKGFVIYIPIIIVFGVCMVNLVNGYYLSALFCVVLVSLIVGPMILNTNYTINTDNTPALSMDRIEIFYNKFDSVIVSPESKLEFIAELTSLNPAIVVKGETK
jgi:hypothetical protein